MLGLFALLLPAPLFDVPTLRGAQVGMYAVSATTGAVIYQRDPDAAMVPASNLKLVVGSAALDLLGPAFSFTTTLASDGSTLYIHGSGDPLLRDSDFDDAARTLADLGQAHFDALAGDASAIDEPRYPNGWQQDDLPYDYAAPPDALSFDENVVQVHLVPGAPGSTPLVTVTPQQDVVVIENDATTGAAGSADTIGAHVVWDSPHTLAIDGAIPAGGTPDDFGLSVLDAPRFTLEMTQRALAQRGIAFANASRLAATPADARVLWIHHSAVLPELLRDMWQPSDNLLAESLLNALGATSAAAGGGDTRTRGLDRERAWLTSIGVDPATTTLDDGSGLSAYDRITPRDLVSILAHDWNGPYRSIVLAALPVAGKSGTLEDSFKGTPLDGALVAKTGTLNHTRALAGYLQTPHGTILFALLVDGWMDPSPHAMEHLRAFQAAVLEALAGS